MSGALRQAWRRLARRPGSSALAVLSLALGIGATTAVFSLLQPALITPLAYPDAGRLRVLAPQPWMHAAVVDELSSAARETAGLAGYHPRAYAVQAADRPIAVPGAEATPGLLRTLGVPLLAGRDFADGGDDAVAVLGAGLASRLFGTAQAAIGRSLQVDGRPLRVIGVAADAGPLPQLDAAELWLPIDPRLQGEDGAPAWMIPVARLRDGQAAAGLQARLEAVLDRWRADGTDFPHEHYRWQGLREALVGEHGRQLLMLQLAVVLVLLLACGNVASLQIARIAERGGELGLRRALGATRVRLLRQVLLDALLLAFAGAVLAACLVALAGDLLASLVPAELARLGRPSLDLGALLFAFGLACTAGVLSAVLPGLRAIRVGPADTLVAPTRGVVGARGGRFAGGALVAAEVALTLVLLVAAGLLLRSVQVLSGQPPGFRSEGVLVMPLVLPPGRHDRVESLDLAWQEIVAAVSGVPGVGPAALANRVPLARGGTTRLFQVEGEDEPRLAQHGIVGPGYLDVLDIPLLRGRFFDAGDRRDSERVTVVDAALAAQVWPGMDPVGRRLRLLMGGADHWLTVVGVVGDIRGSGLAQAPAPGFYIPHSQRPGDAASLAVGHQAVLLVRADARVAGRVAALREAVWSVQPQLPVPEVTGLDAVLADSLAPQRFRAGLVGAFAALALALALAGVHGVVAQVVSGRLHEFGVRKALGASARDIRRTVLRWALGAGLAGALGGLLAALAGARLLAGWLHGVGAADPAVVIAALAILLIVVLLAALAPARRAARIDAVQALREC